MTERLHVDWIACEGRGTCVELLAVRECPRLALRLRPD